MSSPESPEAEPPKAKGRITDAIAIMLIAISWGIYTLGLEPIDIYNRTWLIGDLAQVYVAWVQYISDSGSWLLNSNRMSYPVPMSISLFDPMPLLLFLMKPVALLIPSGYQFFGVYFLTCLFAQGMFGYFVVLELQEIKKMQRSNGIDVTAISGAVIFMTMPYTMHRFMGHTALASHWVLVLSIWVVIKTRRNSELSWIIQNSLVCFIAGGINPYIAFMVLFSNAIFLVFDHVNASNRKKMIRVAALVLVTAIGLYLFGFMSAAGLDGGGYGIYSMNILGPFDSNGLARIFDINVQDATGGQQFEGFNYCGLGVLGAFLVCTARILLGAKLQTDFPFKAAFIVLLVSYLLALSTTITFGSWSLHVPIPSGIEIALSKFRASGRLFWIGAFWIVTIAIAVVSAPSSHRWTRSSPHRLALCTRLGRSTIQALGGARWLDSCHLGREEKA